MGYCIVHNPLLLQPLRHWSTFIFRKYEHLAVEDFVIKDLPDSRGSCLRLLPCFPLCAFIIAHSWLFVKHFFVKSYIYSRRYLTRTSPKENGRESPSPSQLDTIAPTFRTFFHSPSLLYPYCITTWVICQEGFLKNRNLFQKPFPYFSAAVAVRQILVVLYPEGLALYLSSGVPS